MIELETDRVFSTAAANAGMLPDMIPEDPNPMEIDAIEKLRKGLIQKILCRSTPYVYYYQGKDFVPPEIYPGSPAFDLEPLLELMILYGEFMDFDAVEPNIPEDIEVIDDESDSEYQIIDSASASASEDPSSSGSESMDRDTMEAIIASIWEHKQASYVTKYMDRIIDTAQKHGLDPIQVITTMTEFGYPHNITNYDLIVANLIAE